MIENMPAWMNGKFCKVKDLKFSILDLGLIHCDATYDVISAHNKKIFMLDFHLERFYASAEYWKLDIEISKKELTRIIKELCKKSNLDHSLIWLGITRGIPTSGSPRDLKNCKNNLVIYVKPYFNFNSKNSATVCISKIIRTPDFSINQKYKNFAWNDLTLAQWEAIDQGYDTSLLLDYQGYVTEGPGFGVFGLTTDYKIISPKENCLQSITTKVVEMICDQESLIFEKKNITIDELKKCRNICLTSTAGHIISVETLDNIYYTNEDPIIEILRANIEKMINDKRYSTSF